MCPPPIASSDVTMTTSPPAVTTAAASNLVDMGEAPTMVPTSMVPVITSTPLPVAGDTTGQPVISKEMISVIEAVLKNKDVIGVLDSSLRKDQPSMPTLTSQFQNVDQSSGMSMCSLPDSGITTDPVTTPAGSSPDVGTAIVTSSFQSNNKVAITFSVPVLTSTTHTTPNIISEALTSQGPLQSTGVTAANTSFDGSFGGGSTNSSFDQGGFSSEGAVIVTEGAISCQLASSLTNSNAHPMNAGANISIGDGDNGTPSGAVKKYICEHQGCTKAYRYKKDVIRHMKMKHGSQPMRYEQKEVTESFMRKHGCSQCTKMYAHRKDLLRHQRDVHSPDAMVRREALKTNQKRYPCEHPNCHKYYVHKKDLIRHRRNDHSDTTETKDMHIPEPVSPSQLSPGPSKRQRTWSASNKVVSMKPETAAEPTSVSDHDMPWVSVVREGNVAAAMATSDADTLESDCALFNTTTANTETSNSSLISLLNVNPPIDGTSTASVHPLFSAVTSIAQDTTAPSTENNN